MLPSNILVLRLDAYTILLIIVITDLHSHSAGVGWNPANYSYDPGPGYQPVWQDNFENVGPIKGMINGQPAYGSNPNNWVLKTGHITGGLLQNYTDNIENACVENGQLTIVAMREGYSSAMLSSVYL